MTHTIDPFDELAAIFLTEEGESSAPRSAGAGRVELLLVGHLPVRAGLWLTPYADAVARDRGPTALIDLDGAPRVQLLRHPERPVGGGDVRGLHDVIERIASDTRCWVIRPPHEARLADLLALDASADVTILTGADDTAVVRAYRLIGGVVEQSRVAGLPRPRLGVVMVGADMQRAEEAFTRLQRVAASFLDTDVALRRCIPRIDAGVSTTGELPLIDDVAPAASTVLGWIRSGPGRVEPSVEGHRMGEMHEPPSVTNGWPSTAPPLRPAPAEPPVGTHPPAAAGVWADPEARLREVARGPRPSPAKLAPKTGKLVEPKPAQAPLQPEEHGRPIPLARFVDGLSALTERCPHHERIELAVDDGGRLHLLGREDDLRDMRVVETWAAEHRELLNAACRPHRIDTRERPVCHVFTDVPATLADLHSSELMLHVLTPVRVEDRVAWYSAALK